MTSERKSARPVRKNSFRTLKTEYKTSKHRNNKFYLLFNQSNDRSSNGFIHLWSNSFETPGRNIWFVSIGNAMLIENENAASADESLCGLYKRLSKEGRRADALALRADERRGKLR